jgi:hypothetical protein
MRESDKVKVSENESVLLKLSVTTGIVEENESEGSNSELSLTSSDDERPLVNVKLAAVIEKTGV